MPRFLASSDFRRLGTLKDGMVEAAFRGAAERLQWETSVAGLCSLKQTSWTGSAPMSYRIVSHRIISYIYYLVSVRFPIPNLISFSTHARLHFRFISICLRATARSSTQIHLQAAQPVINPTTALEIAFTALLLKTSRPETTLILSSLSFVPETFCVSTSSSCFCSFLAFTLCGFFFVFDLVLPQRPWSPDRSVSAAAESATVRVRVRMTFRVSEKRVN